MTDGFERCGFDSDFGSCRRFRIRLIMAEFTEEQKIQWSRFNALIDQAKQLLNEAETGVLCLERLKTLADQGLDILHKVENLEIAMMDMKLMEILFQIFQLNIRTIHPERLRFSRQEFARRILRYVDVPIDVDPSQQKDISVKLKRKLADMCHAQLCYQAPNFDISIGAFEVTEPAKKVPKQREKRLKRTLGRTLEGTVIEIANILEKAYISNGHKPVNFIEFAFHPKEFSLTVENIFHCSFLVNNNKANIFVDEEKNMPMIVPIEVDSHGEGAELTREGKAAMIIQLTVPEWAYLKN
ncbi:hypothetical protein B566_EDAN006430 [Ephemera danica]|nr:hypothetical protein B566_EDAN006430 [Ephemera danica]